MFLPFCVDSDFHSLFRCCTLGSIINDVIFCTVSRFDHWNFLPEPMPKARQTFTSRSIDGWRTIGIDVEDDDDDVGGVDVKYNDAIGSVDVEDDDDNDVGSGVEDDDDDVGSGVEDDDDDVVGGDVDIKDNDGIVGGVDIKYDGALFVVEDDDIVFGNDNVVVDRISDNEVVFGINSILLNFLIPSHFVFVVISVDGGNEHDKIERWWVDFAAATNSALVAQLCFSSTYRLISPLITAAFRSHGPLPAWASEKSMRRIKTPVVSYNSLTASNVSAPW